MKAMIFCAGLGTRLKPFTDDRPKALVELNGVPLLELVVERLKAFGVSEVVVNVHHFAEKVEEFIRIRNNFGIKVDISDERELLLDTGGGLKKAQQFLDGNEPFIVHNVDIVSNIDLAALYQAHQKGNALATLAVSSRTSSRYFLFDKSMHLAGWKNVKTNEQKIAKLGDTYLPFAFNGIQVVSPQIFKQMDGFEGKFSIVDLYLHLAKMEEIVGFDATNSHIIDVGKPAALNEAAKLMF